MPPPSEDSPPEDSPPEEPPPGILTPPGNPDPPPGAWIAVEPAAQALRNRAATAIATMERVIAINGLPGNMSFMVFGLTNV
jgi:hypothetical protein